MSTKATMSRSTSTHTRSTPLKDPKLQWKKHYHNTETVQRKTAEALAALAQLCLARDKENSNKENTPLYSSTTGNTKKQQGPACQLPRPSGILNAQQNAVISSQASSSQASSSLGKRKSSEQETKAPLAVSISPNFKIRKVVPGFAENRTLVTGKPSLVYTYTF